MQDINVLALHGPNWWKIIIDQIIAKNWKGFWHGQVLIIQIIVGHFYSFMANPVVHDVMENLIYFWFIYTLFCFFFINLKDVWVNVVKENAQVLDEDLKLLWLCFLGMVFDMLLAFEINLIKSKCYIQHTYAIFLFFY